MNMCTFACTFHVLCHELRDNVGVPALIPVASLASYCCAKATCRQLLLEHKTMVPDFVEEVI
jgi:hypothetical protein